MNYFADQEKLQGPRWHCRLRRARQSSFGVPFIAIMHFNAKKIRHRSRFYLGDKASISQNLRKSSAAKAGALRTGDEMPCNPRGSQSAARQAQIDLKTPKLRRAVVASIERDYVEAQQNAKAEWRGSELGRFNLSNDLARQFNITDQN